ncbi:ATP-dependent DNA helicase [Methanocalculus taiwanensis]|uniref:ATP-dependent DNA helicase n=1 Tax=Methanocalculus taiwanensis TaxID=106207 RepID=UPI002101ABEC
MHREVSNGNKGVVELSLETLPIPDGLRDQYYAAGIRSLYPPQITCVDEGLFLGRNLIISIPTASGKTLVAEMAMHHHIASGGKCLYVVPLKALASEKYDDFSGKGVKIGIATGDFDRKDELLGRSDIIVATSEKVDSLLRNRTGWISSITLLVIDEMHLIGDEGRGATLEMVIATMRNRNQNLQVIGLSATIGNPKELAGWLSAGLVQSDWRPVDLREGVYYKGSIRFDGSKREVASLKKDADTNLCLDTIQEGGQALVFVSSRRNAEGAAKRIASALGLEEPALNRIADQILENDESGVAQALALCIKKGAAFHHAGLSRDARKLVEEGFRKGTIRVIASTPTLAAGLNLPARRVIINSLHRFVPGEGQVAIPVREYRQMAGRAGRPGLDPYGEAVLIGKSESAVKELFREFICAPAEEIDSQCAKKSVLLSRILALVASNEATDNDAILSFFSGSFYAFRHRNLSYLTRICTRVTRELEEMGMVVDLGSRIEATVFGELTSKLYLDPRSSVMIQTAFHERETVTPFGILHLLCATPDMFRLFLRSADEELIEHVIEEQGEEILIGEGEHLFSWLGYDDFYQAIKTAIVLQDWIGEVSVEMIAERYSIGPGDIHGLVDGIGWLVHGARELCRREMPAHLQIIADLELRIRHGVKEELLPLIRLRGIGRVRARSLFNSGYTTPGEIRDAGVEKIARIVGQKTAESIIQEIQNKEIGKRSGNQSGNLESGEKREKKKRPRYDGKVNDETRLDRGDASTRRKSGQQRILDF